MEHSSDTSESSTSAKFAELLQLLASEHARAVGSLRKEVEHLKRQHDSTLSKASLAHPTPIEMEAPPPLPDWSDDEQDEDDELDSQCSEDDRSDRSLVHCVQRDDSQCSPKKDSLCSTKNGAPRKSEEIEGCDLIDLPELPSKMQAEGNTKSTRKLSKVSFKSDSSDDDKPARMSKVSFGNQSSDGKGGEDATQKANPSKPNTGGRVVGFNREDVPSDSQATDVFLPPGETIRPSDMPHSRGSILDQRGIGGNMKDSNAVRFKLRGIWSGIDHDSSSRFSMQGQIQKREFNKFKTGSLRGSNIFQGLGSLASRVFHAQDSRCSLKILYSILNGAVSHPNSRFNAIMDAVCLLLVAFDAAVLPLDSFDIVGSTFMATWYIISASYWTCDLLRNFFTGFFRQGAVVLELDAVVMHYAKRWFLVDLAMLVTDWVVVHFQDGFAGRLLDTRTRVLHGLRLLRVLGIRRFMKAFEEKISSELVMVTWTMGELFMCIVAVNHFLACCWYGIGRFSQPGPNWVETYLDTPNGADFSYQYLSSYHWALTQFTPASISIQPHNVYERCFNVIVLLFALMTVSTFVSGITAAVMRLQAMHATRNKQFWHLRKYLKEHHVPASIAVRVTNYCSFAYEQKSRKVKEDNVQLLALLSVNLKSELRTSIYQPFIEHHPFFVLMSRICTLSFQALCHNGMHFIELAKGDKLFNIGQTCDQMFFISTPGFDASHSYRLHGEEKPEEVHFGDWLCEPALWTHWSNKGTLEAIADSSVVATRADKFCAAMRGHQDSLEESMQYGNAFLQGLNRVPLDRLSDLYRSPKVEGLWFRLMSEFRIHETHDHGHNAQSRHQSMRNTRTTGRFTVAMEGTATRVAQWKDMIFKPFQRQRGSAEMKGIQSVCLS